MISPGDTVICINASHHIADQISVPVKAGQQYMVQGLKTCRCGAIFLNVGLPLTVGYDIVCNCQRRHSDGIWWLSDMRFKRIDSGAGESVEITLTETVTRSVTIRIHR